MAGRFQLRVNGVAVDEVEVAPTPGFGPYWYRQQVTTKVKLKPGDTVSVWYMGSDGCDPWFFSWVRIRVKNPGKAGIGGGSIAGTGYAGGQRVEGG